MRSVKAARIEFYDECERNGKRGTREDKRGRSQRQISGKGLERKKGRGRGRESAIEREQGGMEVGLANEKSHETYREKARGKHKNSYQNAAII